MSKAKRAAQIAHQRIWTMGQFDTVSYEIQPVFEPTSPLKFIVFARYMIKIEGEEIRSEGPVAAFVHKDHAELFVRAVTGPYVYPIQKQMS